MTSVRVDAYAVIESKSGRKPKDQTRGFMQHFKLERVISCGPLRMPFTIRELTGTMFPFGQRPVYHTEVDGTIVIAWCVFPLDERKPVHITTRVPPPRNAANRATPPRTRLDNVDRERLIVACFGNGNQNVVNWNEDMNCFVSSIKIDDDRAWAVCIPTQHPHLDTIVNQLPLQRLVDHGDQTIPYVLQVRLHNGEDGKKQRNKSGVIITHTIFHSLFWSTSLIDKCDIFAPVGSNKRPRSPSTGSEYVTAATTPSTSTGRQQVAGSGGGGSGGGAIGVGKVVTRSSQMEQLRVWTALDTRTKLLNIFKMCANDTKCSVASSKFSLFFLGVLLTMHSHNAWMGSEGIDGPPYSLEDEHFQYIANQAHDMIGMMGTCSPCDVMVSIFQHLVNEEEENFCAFIDAFAYKHTLNLLQANIEDSNK